MLDSVTKATLDNEIHRLCDLYSQGHIKDVLNQSTKLLERFPDSIALHIINGDCNTKLKRFDTAIMNYKRAIDLHPNFAVSYFNLGIALQDKGDSRAALKSYRIATKINPHYLEAHYNIGSVLHEMGDLNAAIESYKTSLKIDPNYSRAYNNLGNALKEQSDLTAAIASFHQALKLKPDYPEAYNNLGNALQLQGDLNTAIASYQQAIKLKPDYPEAHGSLGLVFLLNGDYQQGWLENEYRSMRVKKPVIPHANPSISQWQGETLNSNDKLLVVSEQGLGDTMQFMRYIPHLRQQGFDVSFCAQPKLHDLIKSSGVTSNLLTPEQAISVKEGKWIPLLSVPRLLEVTPKNPVVTDPYIHCSDELTTKWKEILSTEQKPIIGINWQGNPDTETNNLTGRSIPLELFSSLATGHDHKFLSLQKGFGSEQLETCSFQDQFVDCQSHVNETWDFLETAAIIANCDLVITSDTSVAHLAAGMGKPTWCLLHYIPDWRWGMNGETSFWYPSMRLFRQQQRNNWSEVMERVSAELKSYKIRD